ncbi:MAG: ABC transporter permease [Chloroflexi bacterium]|nr:ABC transporter permease [Chloroflexota bacterium]
MSSYIIKRLLQAFPQMLIITMLLFILTANLGDPLATFGGTRRRLPPADRARLEKQLGLDQPVFIQYSIWLVGNNWMDVDTDADGISDSPGTRLGILRGDLGNSFQERRPALDVISERIWPTMLLMVTSEIIVIIFALIIGTYSALNQYSFSDNLLTTLSFIGYSMPIFWLALMLIYIFSVYFQRWGLPSMPTVGMYDLNVGPTPGQIALHLVLPLTTLSVVSIASYSRYVRSQMLEVLGQDYIRTAYAKGLPEQKILFRHALKNAALPLVTIIGLDLPLLLGGTVVTEAIFGWPGMGRLFYKATNAGDIPVTMGILLLISVLVVGCQLITDIAYTYFDPRIRYE